MVVKLSYTLREAAQATGLSVRFLGYAVADSRLKSVKVGGRRLIPARDLENFILGEAARGVTQEHSRAVQGLNPQVFSLPLKREARKKQTSRSEEIQNETH